MALQHSLVFPMLAIAGCVVQIGDIQGSREMANARANADDDLTAKGCLLRFRIP